ncbi:hypothetical protein C8Q76DRAFT_365672 [Earliella scabrosa]|nr:hypothetical protein C8Q76DRAFT_365672 [Earliella scabrosa]
MLLQSCTIHRSILAPCVISGLLLISMVRNCSCQNHTRTFVLTGRHWHSSVLCQTARAHRIDYPHCWQLIVRQMVQAVLAMTHSERRVRRLGGREGFFASTGYVMQVGHL